MGKLETENRKIIRRTKIQEAILGTIASGGRMGHELITKQVIGVLFQLDLNSHTRVKDVVKSSASRLAKKGLLKFEDGHYSLTEKGSEILQQWHRADLKLKQPKKWDGKWRIVIFDIPERKRVTRDEVREIFKAAGFQHLQDSVWVYPYDCEDIIGLLKNDFGIGKYILYIIADQIENDKYLRMDFGLV